MSFFTLSFQCVFFFFNDTATTEIYTLSLHDALPISVNVNIAVDAPLYKLTIPAATGNGPGRLINDSVSLAFATAITVRDRKSTRLNSSHLVISYAVFCLKKKKQLDLL